MGRNYSFQVLFERSEVDSVLSGLASILVERDRERIERSLPWEPERINRAWALDGRRLFEVQCGIKGVRDPNSDGVRDSYCFSFHFPLTRNLHRLAKEYHPSPKIQDRRQTHIEIGSVWTRIQLGRKWGVLELSAVGTSMSLLFQKSVEIQQALVNALGACSEVIVLCDYEGWPDEEQALTLLHPYRRKIVPWDRDQVVVCDEYQFEGGTLYIHHGLDPDRFAFVVFTHVFQ